MSFQAKSADPRWLLPALLVLFVGSGCSALIYEIVWFQMLELVIGSSALSLGVLLSTFMGGMCLGSLLVPRVVSGRRHPLIVYALLELGIGLIGILVLFAMPSIDRVYVASIGHGLGSVSLRAVVCAVCLLPPTLLMGATLPVIARWVEATPQGMSWLGLFYGGNIAGAVFGCLLAGFWLLRVYDVATATYVAVAVNFAVGAVGLGLASIVTHCPPSDRALPLPKLKAAGAWRIHLVVAVSGLCALGAEVLWTRLLSLMLGATVYTFSIILAIFLFGLGIGSSISAILCRRANAFIVLGCCQFLLAIAICWAAFVTARWLPYWQFSSLAISTAWSSLLFDALRCAWAVLPAALLWGASFPAAIAAVASRGQDPARLVGGVYAANTLGAIVGSICFSAILIPQLGTQEAHRILILLSSGASFLMLAPYLRLQPAGRFHEAMNWFSNRVVRLASAVAALVLLISLTWRVPGVPWELIAYGRHLSQWLGMASVLYVGEGMNSSVAVTELASGERNFHVSGKIEASSEPQDMRLQRMLGHVPAMIHPNPQSVLVVGCGAGVTAGSFVVYPSVRKIVICEIEPLIPRVVARHFAEENHRVLEDRRVQVVYDDARHYILTTRDKFDIITSDPIHPWVKGAATLYTREYFELCKRRLNPGGIVAQWVPLYESSVEAVQTEIRTFFEVFPDGTIWSNDIAGRGYDIVLLGQPQPTRIVVDLVQQRLSSDEYAAALDSINEVGFRSGLELLATYAGSGRDLAPWLHNAEINGDRDLRLQYLAGMGLNANRGSQIHDEMMQYCRFPHELFAGSAALKQEMNMEIAKVMLRRTVR